MLLRWICCCSRSVKPYVVICCFVKCFLVGRYADNIPQVKRGLKSNAISNVISLSVNVNTNMFGYETDKQQSFQTLFQDRQWRDVSDGSHVPLGFVAIFPKRLGIFQPNFMCPLRIPIYARLRIFIQLSATLTKLCHLKRDRPVMICHVRKMATIGRNAHWHFLTFCRHS